jgi:fibronectin type 3 domain-containing protein
MRTLKSNLLAVLTLATSVGVSQAQTLLLRMPFTDTGAGTTAQSDTSSGGANVVLNLLNQSGTPTDFHGIPGGGVSGLNVALDFSTNSDLSGSPGGNAQNGPIAENTSTALNFGVMTAYTATIWFKALTPEFYGSGHYTRVFTLGANGTADKGVTNSLGVFWNNSTSINCAFNQSLSLAGSVQPGAFAVGQWYFIAVTYDGSTATIYQGTDGGAGVTSVASQGFAGGTITLNNAGGSVLTVGNQLARARPFDGWINDFRFYSGVASASLVEDIRWSSLAPLVAAVPGNSQVSLTFTNLTGAASFTVYRSTSPTGPFNTSPTGGTGLTSPSFTDTTAVNGTTYYYEVTAVNANGDGTTSQNSQPVVVTPEPLPTTPQFTAATAGNGSVSLSWTASTGLPAPITYSLAKSTVSGSEVFLLNTSATSYVDTSVANGIEYFYTVTAFSALGETSATSIEVNSTPTGPPVAPAQVTADAVAGGGVLVSWTEVPSATFTILRSTTGPSGTYSTIATGQAGPTYFDAGGVLGDYYEVVAVGAGGSSPDSSDAKTVPQLLNVNFDSAGSGNNFGSGENPALAAASGAGAIGSPGDIWNGENTLGATTFTAGALVNSDGSASAVTLSLFAAGGAFDNNSPGFGIISPFSWASVADMNADIGYPNSPYAALMSSAINTGASGANSFVALGGLTPGAAYTLFVYSAGNDAGRISSFWITNNVYNGPTNSCTYDDHTITMVSGVDYLEFSASADVNGDLTINFGNGLNENDLCGFQLIEGSVQAAAITTSAPLSGLTLCTNTTLTFTAASGSLGGVPSTTIIAFTNIVRTSPLGSSVTTSVTNVYKANGTFSGTVIAGMSNSPATLTLPLSPNVKYAVSVTAVQAAGTPLVSALAFDTFAPALVIEVSDYNFNGGSWLETPVNGGVWLDYNQPDLAVQGTDFNKTGGEGPVQAIWGGAIIGYRDVGLGTTPPGDAPYVVPANADTFSEEKDAVATTGTTAGVNDFPELSIGYATTGDWWNYTRTYGNSGYPVDSATNGTYDVWLYMAEGAAGGPQATLSSVPNPANPSAGQTLTQLGQFGTGTFAEADWNGYEYVPMTDQYGNIVSTTISGQETLQLQLGPGPNPNVGFVMLMPATPVLTPGLSYIYPNGQPFQMTNVFDFTVTPNNGSNILTSGIDLVLNGVDVSAGLTINPAAGNTWKVSYPLYYNTIYAAVISITNTAGVSSIFSYNFDTFNPNNYQWEAVDYDFSTNNGNFGPPGTPPAQGGESVGGWISGQFIDNPVPTADTTSTTVTGPLGETATNSYFDYPTGFTPGIDPVGAGAIAQQGVDINVTGNGQGAGQFLYRAGEGADGAGNQVATDTVRAKFLAARTEFNDPNIGPYNLGYVAAGNWFNYTRHYPAGSYNIYARLAFDAPFSLSLGQVTAGVGTGTQTITGLGTFTSTNGAGYQAWQTIPLLDANNNPIVITFLSGQAVTFQAQANTGINMEYFMLVTAPPAFIVTPSYVAGQFKMAFPTQSGYTYQVQYRSSLTASSWGSVGLSITGDGTVHTVLESPSGFYRVVATANN